MRENVDNVLILNAIRKNATIDYQRRIPEATKANVQDVIQNLINNRPGMNEFIDGLVNRIGLVLYRNTSWTNPLAKFKRGMLEYGNTIEEIATGLLEAKTYIHERDYLEKDIFGQEVPETRVNYHKVSRENYYKLSIKEQVLRRAFLSSTGLSEFITNLMAMPVTSDNWDEFLLTTSLFRQYYDAGGFFNVNVPDLSVLTADSADAKQALRSVRTMAETLPFLSRHYNAAGLPIAAMPDELELFITPEANATLDVEALAAAFNIERANVNSRTTIVPQEHFNIPGAQAVLSTKDFFVIADSLITTTSVQNPVGLVTNYFLHHHQVVSASTFVPAILFTTEESTVINIPDTPVTSVSAVTAIDADGATVTAFERGLLYEVNAQAVTTPANGENDAVRYEAVGFTSPRSRLNQNGALVVAIDESAVSVKVIARAVENNNIFSEATFAITGDILIPWPNPEVIPDADNDGLNEVTPEPLTVDANDDVLIPSVRGVQYKRAGADVANGSIQHITASTTFTAVARTNFELAAGATASWTLAP